MGTIMEALGGKSGETIMEVVGGKSGETIADILETKDVTIVDKEVNPLDKLAVDFDIAADTDLLGKFVTDLQENMAISGDAITGTSKWVTGYTGFSSKTSEQKGNYIALHVSIPGMTIGQDGLSIKVNNSALDSDGLIVLIFKGNANPITVVATKGDYSKTLTLDKSGVTLQPESVGE